MINAGAGDDTVYGDAGDDIFVTASGDGNDTYYGDDGVQTRSTCRRSALTLRWISAPG